MRQYIDIINEYNEPKIVPEIDPKKLAQAQADGFDVGKLWYHGTRRKFSTFRLPKRGGIDELGGGVYVTRYPGTANAWAQGSGFVLACVLRQGKLIELSDIPRSQLWHSGPEVEDRFANPLWREAYRGFELLMRNMESRPGAGDAHGGYRDFAERINNRKIDLGRCLAEVGYIGATDRYSQIKGQAVIWKPEDVRIVGKASGFEGFVYDREEDY